MPFLLRNIYSVGCFFISPQHVKRDPFINDNILLWWNSSDIFMAAIPDIGMVVLG